MGRFLATLATLLILVLGAAFVVPAFTDWAAYRPDIEQAASAILGRKIHILGDIDIALLPEPYLHASKIAAEDMPGDGAVISAEAVDLSLSLNAILSGRLEANKLRLVRPSLALDFSKPIRGWEGTADAGPFSLATAVNNLEIEDGRVSVFSKEASVAEALTLTKINGKVSAVLPGNSYRFSGRLLQKGHELDVKFLASPAAGKSIKIATTALDPLSKIAVQAEGLVGLGGTPAFDGSLAVTIPQQGERSVEMQLKSTARIDLTSANLTDLVITLDPQNRAQILAGSAAIAFANETANLALQARSLDADALASALRDKEAATGGEPAAGWSAVRTVADSLLWLYPNFGLRVSFSTDLLQLGGEAVDAVKFTGTRTAQRWVVEQALATFPGETALRLAGTVSRKGGQSQLSGTAAFNGRNVARFIRWIAPGAGEKAGLTSREFNLQGALTLSGDVTAFEAVNGSIDGIPFSANLHVDRAPLRKLQLAVVSESFDLTGLEASQAAIGAWPGDGLKAAWQGALSQVGAVLGEDPRGFPAADIALSARTLRTGFAELKNFDVRAKINDGLLTLSKFTAETDAGLSLRGEGAAPLQGSGQGRFDGRVEARSAQAFLQLAAVLGLGEDGLRGRRADDFAPAALTINLGTDTRDSSSTALITGSFAQARVEARAQIKGNITDWKTGLTSAQLNVAAVDGNKLLAQIFPKVAFASAASLAPGSIAIRVNGTPEGFETAGTLKTGPLQIQLDGTTKLETQNFVFSGKASVSSQSPEQFLPAPMLALFGAEPKANLRIDTSLKLAPGRVSAEGLKAESPNNLVAGRLLLDAPGNTLRIDADLKADRLSMPALLGYLLTAPPQDQATLFLPATNATPSAPIADIWSDRPFSLSAFQDTSAKIVLGVKTLAISDTLALSNAQIAAKLEKGRLDIQKLEGKALDGDVSASLVLEAKGAVAGVSTRVSLSNADLSQLPIVGSSPLVTGRASLLLTASGQGLSPRGLLPVLDGRGVIALSDGQLSKFAPAAVQKSAEDLIAAQQPLNEASITKKVLEASQSSDFKFKRLKIPVTIRDGIVEIRRASFRNRDGTVRMEGYLDLSKMQADTTWQAGVGSDRRAKWPPIKILVSGPLRELGARPRTLAAEDFVRAITVRKMEGDMTKLEGLNKPQGAPQSWTATQEPVVEQPSRRRKRDGDGSKVKPVIPSTATAVKPDFEARMRDALQSRGTATPDAR